MPNGSQKSHFVPRLGWRMAAARFVLIAAVAPAVPTDARAYDPVSARREVLALDERRARAFVQDDTDLLDRITAPDYTHVETSGVARTKAEFIADRRTGKLRFLRFDIDANEARTFGDVVVVTGQYSNQVENAQGVQPLKRARHQRVYVRRNGAWLVVAHQATEIVD